MLKYFITSLIELINTGADMVMEFAIVTKRQPLLSLGPCLDSRVTMLLEFLGFLIYLFFILTVISYFFFRTSAVSFNFRLKSFFYSLPAIFSVIGIYFFLIYIGTLIQLPGIAPLESLG
jgi:hypothetical protein